MIADNGDRFARVAIGNTGLPYNPDIPPKVVEEIISFRNSEKKLTLFSMMKEIRKMNGIGGKNHDGARRFAYWQKYTWQTPDVPAGIISSSQMEKRNPLIVALELFTGAIGLRKISPFRTQLSTIYEAPFPSPEYKMAVRAMPTQVPSMPDQSLEAQKKAWDFFETFEKPFLCVGAGNDPITVGFEKPWLAKVPGTKGQPHATIGGGHFFQWAKAEELANILSDFILKNSAD
jgi:haloalkane dehalogenase